MKKIFGICLVCLLPLNALAQTDPVAERQARNAAMERVSPVMERELSIKPTEQEQVLLNLSEYQLLLGEINQTLSDLSLLGNRTAQAALLMSLDQPARETLLDLIESEAERFEESQSAPPPQPASPTPMRVSSQQPPVTGSSGAPLLPSSKSEPTTPVQTNSFATEITPLIVRDYEDPNRPAKVFLKIGKQDASVFYEGEQVDVNGLMYTIESVTPVGKSTKLHGRTVYEIVLRSDRGDIRRLTLD